MLDTTDENQPVDISVIIPVRRLDDPDLCKCLNSLRRQRVVGKVEVIVVEGGNIAQARNEGIRASKGKYAAFIDSDCQAPENWLSTMLLGIEEIQEFGGIGGINISLNNTDRFSKSIDAVFRSYLGSLGSISLYQPTKTKVVNSLSTSNSIYKISLLKSVEGFDERYILNEDTELNTRITSKGHKLYLYHKSVVYHKRPKTLSSYSKKFYNWGISRMRAMLTDKRLVDIRVLVLFILLLVFPFTFSVSTTIALVLPLAYLILLVLHGVYYSIKKRDPLLVLYLPILYVAQHFSYWLGLFRGFFKGKYHENKSATTFKIHYEKLGFEDIGNK